jgi:hypothetical protein
MTPALQLLRTNSGRLLLLAAVSALCTAIVTSRLPRGVDVSLPFTIPVPGRPLSGAYEYDGYYALQATDLFAGTLAGWLTSPDLVADVYAKAGLAQPARSVRTLARVFTARKLSGQLVELRFHARTGEDAQRVAEHVTAIVHRRTEQFNKEGGTPLQFSVTSGEPLVLPVQRSVPLRALVGGLVAFVFGASALLLWDAARPPEGDSDG